MCIRDRSRTKSDLTKVSKIIKKTKGSSKAFVCDVTNLEEFEKVLKDYSWINVVTQGKLAPVIELYGKSSEEMKSIMIKYCLQK